jgi:hypothetical protein
VSQSEPLLVNQPQAQVVPLRSVEGTGTDNDNDNDNDNDLDSANGSSEEENDNSESHGSDQARGSSKPSAVNDHETEETTKRECLKLDSDSRVVKFTPFYRYVPTSHHQPQPTYKP